jgi:hypothetical protein
LNEENGGDTIFRIAVNETLDLVPGGGNKSTSGGSFEKKLAQMAKEAEKEDAQIAEQFTKNEEMLRQQMSRLNFSGNGTTVLSGSQVGAIISQNATEISSAAATYAEDTKLFVKDESASGTQDSAAALLAVKQNQLLLHTRQRDQLKLQLETVLQKVSDLQSKSSGNVNEKYDLLEQEKLNSLEYISQLNSKIAKLSELEAAHGHQNELNELKRLLSLSESLTQQELDFKQSCKVQMKDLKEKIALFEASSSDGSDGSRSQDALEDQKMGEIEETHEKVFFV